MNRCDCWKKKKCAVRKEEGKEREGLLTHPKYFERRRRRERKSGFFILEGGVFSFLLGKRLF